MSNRRNHRRDEHRRTEHGPRFEHPDPGKGCNSTHVARARRKWQGLLKRRHRRITRFRLTAGAEPDAKRRRWDW